MPTQVIEEKRFEDDINGLRVDWKRLDSAMTTLQPALLTVPDIFPQVPGTQLRRVKLTGFSGVPPLSIFFSVRGTVVHLEAAELIDFEE